jgi:hypothetical protein
MSDISALMRLEISILPSLESPQRRINESRPDDEVRNAERFVKDARSNFSLTTPLESNSN